MDLEKQVSKNRDAIVSKQPSESERRKSFIRRHGLLPLIGAIALNVATVYKETPAEAAEVAPGMTWEQGFSALKEDLRTSPVEQSANAVVLKNGTVYWSGSKMGEKTDVQTQSSDVLATVENEIADKSLEGLCSFHTHPILSAEHAKIITKPEAEYEMVRDTTTLSIPPSATDVNPFQFGSVGIRSKIEDAGGYVVSVVFDPSRVWRHRMATDADFQKSPGYWKEILDARELFPEWKQHIKTRLEAYSEEQLDALRGQLPQVEQDSIANSERYRGRGNTSEQVLGDKRRGVYMTLLTKKATPELMAEIYKDDEIGRKLQEQWDAIGERRKKRAEAWNDVVYEQWVPASLKGEPTVELKAKLTEAYLRIGTVIESFTYEEVKNDPLKLCRWPEARMRK